jgi:hypothetical protein
LGANLENASPEILFWVCWEFSASTKEVLQLGMVKQMGTVKQISTLP